jgi:cob(I)alamin adenosyltransferase
MATRIYTRSGDAGDTGLFGGRRVAKSDLRVEAYGAVDELNASLGVARTSITDLEIDALLRQIQNDLFHVGSDLATPLDGAETKGKITIKRVSRSLAVSLETEIDRFEADLPALTQFVLPGGHPAAAALHFSRTVCRRAERRCVSLARSDEPTKQVNPEIIRYLNRLSDLLFVLARTANHRNGVPDVHWNPEV